MAVNQEENLFSSGIKFDDEGFLERCQITERENPKRFDDYENPMIFRGDSFGKISSLDAIRCIDRETCGFKTKETSEDVDDNKKVGSTIYEECPCEGCNALRGDKEEDFLPLGFERYWKSWCNLVHERKGLEKDTSSPNFPLDLDFNFVRIEDEFGSAKKIGSALRSKDVTVNNNEDCILDPLSVEGFSVHNDPLPWRNIHIEHPLNDKITDDDLLRMTNLAQGTLHSLSLVECRKITATCLRRILLSNPWLYEVSVVLKGETMILNTEGYFGDFTERCPRMRIDLNLPSASDDSQSEISFEDSATSASDDSQSEISSEDSATDDDKVYEDFFTDDDPFGLGSSPQSQMHCEDIAAALPPTDFFGMGVSISSPADDYSTDPFGVDWRKGEFVASVLDWVFN